MSGGAWVVRAPGKVLLAGEYAVLHGAPAIVAAVSRHVEVRRSPPGDARSRLGAGGSTETAALAPEVRLAIEAARRQISGAAHPALTVTTSELMHSSGAKLGLGSSAAAAVAAAAFVHVEAGAALTDSATRRAVFDAALEGHAAVAPQGSGADVAASTFGGVLRVERTAAGLARQALSSPPVDVRVLWTGRSVRTSDLVARVADLERADRRTHGARMDDVAAAATAAVDAWTRADSAALVRAVHAARESLRALGEAAGAPIVDDALAAQCAVAAEVGGAAKPSGAGGGDVLVAFLPTGVDLPAFEARARAAGLEPLDLSVGAPGVHAVTAAEAL